MSLHIGIAGPISTENIKHFLDENSVALPAGYAGAPLLGTLIGELLSHGHQVSVYTTSSDLSLDLVQPIIAQGERFKIYYCPSRPHSIRMNGRYLGRIVDFFRLERRYLLQAMVIDDPEVIHAHWAYEFALATITSGKPHVVTCHDAPQKILKFMPNLYRLGRFFMAVKAMHSAGKMTTVSPYMSDSLTYFSNKNIEIIPNPLPPIISRYHFDYSRKLSRESSVIVMVSNGWDKRKNSQAGLLAFAILHTTLSNVRLKVFGNGFGVGEVAYQWARKQGITTNIEFVGKLPYEELMEEIANADVLLHPSFEESFGMVLAEAMALGVPVVGGKMSGAVPWVVGSGGMLIDVTKPVEIASTLQAILTDQNKWQALREEASSSARERFASNRVVCAYETLYYQQLEEVIKCS